MSAAQRERAALVETMRGVGPDQKWLTTEGFLDKVDENLNKALVG